MENNAPIVSVIVPVYNAKDDLSECLASISAQTSQNWEAILVDDGSTDGSAQICDEAAKNDPRFRVIHKENGGVSRARNDGIDAARGKYIMFVDADDLIEPACISEMAAVAEKHGTDLVLCGFDRFDDDQQKVTRLTRFYLVMFRDLKDFLLLYSEPKTNMFGVSIWAKLFRTDVIRAHNLRFDPEISYEEDCIFVTDYLRKARSIAGLGAAMYHYRQQTQSLSKSYRKDTFRFLVNGYNRRCELVRENDLPDYLPKLKSIFFVVIKTTCEKIRASKLSKEERIEEYRKLIAFPEVQRSVIFEKDSDSRYVNRIRSAIRRKNPELLDRVISTGTRGDKLFPLLYKVVHPVKAFFRKLKQFVKRLIKK